MWELRSSGRKSLLLSLFIAPSFMLTKYILQPLTKYSYIGMKLIRFTGQQNNLFKVYTVVPPIHLGTQFVNI